MPGDGALWLSQGKAERKRVLVLVAILVVVVLGAVSITINFLYSAAIDEERERLLETAMSQARLIEAVARYDQELFGEGEDAVAATLSQIVNAHEQYEGFGETGEFVLARREEDRIVFLLSHRQLDLEMREPIPIESEMAEPMRRALQGMSGTVVGFDYRGVRVLAAHEPVGELDLGIVVKIDLSEVRRPFYGAALYSIGPAFGAILLAAWVFSFVTRPIIRRIGEGEQRYRDLVETMSEGLAVYDADDLHVWVNDRYCEILGRPRQEVLGQPSVKFDTPESAAGLLRQMADRIEGSTEIYEATFARPDGSLAHTLISPCPLFDSAGEFAGSFAVISDVTRLKEVQTRLRLEKERTQKYLNTASILFVVIDQDGQIELINHRGAEILGYDSPDELIGKDWIDTCIPVYRRDAVRQATNSASDEIQAEAERSVVTRAGEIRFISWMNSLLRDETGNPAGMLAAGIDVTDRRRIEERFRLAAEVSSDLIYEWNIETNELRWFGDIDKTLGYDPGTISPTIESWIDRIHPEDAQRLVGSVERHRTSVEPIYEHYRIRHRDGRWRHWIDRGSPLFSEEGSLLCWIGACVDVTALRRHATQLQIVSDVGQRISSILDLDELLAQVTRLIRDRFCFYHVGCFLAGEESRFHVASTPEVTQESREAELSCIVGPDGVIGRAVTTKEPFLVNDVTQEPLFISHPLLSEAKAELAVPILHEGQVIAVLDILSDRRDGFEPDDASVMMALGGQLGTAIVNARLYDEAKRELQERKQAQRALQISEKQYRSLFTNAILGIYQTTPDGRILAANPALIRMLGFSSLEDLTDRNLEAKEYLPEYSQEEFTGQLEKDGQVSGFESAWMRKDGTPIYVRESARAIRNAEGEVLYYEGTIEDMTEQHEAERAKEDLEAQLVQNQKLESIGTLASGVAHEINNPLTGIINYAQLIQDRIQDEVLAGFAAGIVREGNRVATIVKNLLAFSRQEKERHSPANVADIVSVVVSLIGSILRRDQIDLQIDLPEGLPKLRCRSQQIEQVLLNLMVNARDALNHRYPEFDTKKVLRLTVRLRHVDGEPWIRMAVQDFGAGIPDDIIDRIFDPFFTTKPRDEGTGLGLSISHGIIREHRGTLSVEREPGEGTRFIIDLPVHNGWTPPGGECAESGLQGDD